jgi:4-amino-4-deoxy-L-arabinose transferase-like glycosyltransferase
VNDRAEQQIERRTSLAIIAGTVVVYVLVLTAIPARFPGTDEARYLGIGLNFLRGAGAVTAFGTFFQPHSPLWPAVMAAPQAWFGVDAYGWAHVLNVLTGAIVVVLGAAIGWRIRPAAGAMAAASLLAFPFILDLSRHLGLDMPVAASTLGYLVVGHRAVLGGKARWSIATGVLLAIGFLIKESLLPFVPVPFLAGIAAGVPAGRLARVTAWTALIGSLGTSWWWLLFATETGRVYRLGTPAWTLVPLGLAVAGTVAIGFGWDRLTGSAARAAPRVHRALAARHLSRRLIAWALASLSALAFGVFFDRARNLSGLSLLDPGQLAFYGEKWLPQVRPLLAIGGIGALIDLASRVFAGRRPGSATDELWLVQLCGLPLLLLVAAVGDVPRHLVAQMVILMAIGAGGWLWLLQSVATRSTTVGAVALGLAGTAAAVILAPLATINPRVEVAVLVVVAAGLAVAVGIAIRPATRGRVGQWLRQDGTAIGAASIVFIASSAVYVVVAATQARPALDERKAGAVKLASGWLRDNAPPHSTIAFGGLLTMETAVDLGGTYPLAIVRESGATLDPQAPLGIADRFGGADAGDWISLGPTPQQAAVFAGFRASDLVRQLRAKKVDFWVQMTDSDDNPQRIVEPALTPERGFTPVAQWNVSNAGGLLRVVILRVDRARLALGSAIWIYLPTLDALVTGLEATADPHRAVAAQALLERVVAEPSGPPADALLARLRAIAGR